MTAAHRAPSDAATIAIKCASARISTAVATARTSPTPDQKPLLEESTASSFLPTATDPDRTAFALVWDMVLDPGFTIRDSYRLHEVIRWFPRVPEGVICVALSFKQRRQDDALGQNEQGREDLPECAA